MVNKFNTSEELFKEWRGKYKGYDFTEDGIIDPKRWENSPKTLFILKESYHDKGAKGDWDMRKGLLVDHKGPFGQTFWKTAYLSYTILQLTQNKIPQFSNNKKDKELIEAFLSSSIINIKKPVGNKTSEINDLQYIVDKDKDLIKNQIDLINPKIILCGGTWELIKKPIIGEYKEIATRAYKSQGRIIFDFWHPGMPASGEALHDALCWIAINSKKFNILI